MAVTSPHAQPAAVPEGSDDRPLPALKHGDRLSRVEFERRYYAMPEVTNAELIEGIVSMPSPVRHRGHSSPHSQIVTWLVTYAAETPGVESGDHGSVRLDDMNEPQPDAMLFLTRELGGQVEISDDDYVVGAPELVVEVASSSKSHDLGGKLAAYHRNGVREYLVWRANERRIDWFVFRSHAFELLGPTDQGILRSEVFPGLWLDPGALVRGELLKVFDVLRRGLESDAHMAVVTRLKHASAR